MGKHRSNDLKNAVTNYYLQNNTTFAKTSEVFNIPEETIRRWLNRYKSEGHVRYKYRGSMSYKLTQKHFDYIKQFISEHKDVYLKELQLELADKLNLNISLMHLSRVVHDINYTRKLWTREHYPKERYGVPLDYQENLKAFTDVIKRYDFDDMICIDETNIQLGMDRSRARCYIGKRCIKKTDNNAIFQRFSLLVAISTKRVEGWLLQKGAIKSEDLKPFIEDITKQKRRKRLIIIDNAPSHKKGLDKHVANLHHELLYILPYQHKLNPIENFFNQLKHYIRDRKPMNEKEVRTAIEYAIRMIRPEQLKAYYMYAYAPEKLDKPIKRRQKQYPKKIYKNSK